MTTYERAHQIWSVLAWAARNRQVITYDILGRLIGVPRQGQNCRSSSRPTARKAEATVLLPGARIVPTSSSWTCCQTRLENSGAKGVKSRIIVVGRVRTRSPLFERTGDERTLPPSLQMAKVQQKRCSRKFAT